MNLRCVSTINELRDLQEYEGTCVLALGYRTPSDGGGGYFRWDIAARELDNTGTIIKPHALPASHPGRYIRDVDTGMLNVRWFGAHGDGASDDTAAFQQCHDAAGLIGHKQIFVPVGIYILEGLVLSGIGIKGEPGAILKLAPDAENRMIIISGKDLSFEKLYLDGNAPNNLSCLIGDNQRAHGQIALISNVIGFNDGILVKNYNPNAVHSIHGLSIHDCTFENTRHFPIYLYALSRRSRVHRECQVTPCPPDFKTTQGYVHHVNVSNCRFSNCPGGWMGCIGPDTEYPYEPLCVQVHHNYFDDAMLERGDLSYDASGSGGGEQAIEDRLHSNGFLFRCGSEWKITHNHLNDTGRGITKSADISDFLFSDNSCKNLRGGIFIASSGAKAMLVDLNIRIMNNDLHFTVSDILDDRFTFLTIGQRELINGRGITVSDNVIDGGDIERDECDAISLISIGLSDVRIRNNRFIGWDHAVAFYSGDFTPDNNKPGNEGIAAAKNQAVVRDNLFLYPRRSHFRFRDSTPEKSGLRPDRWLLDVDHNTFVGGCAEGGSCPVGLSAQRVVRALNFTNNRFEENGMEIDLSITDQPFDVLRLSANNYDKGANVLASTIKEINEKDLMGKNSSRRMYCVGNQQFRTKFLSPQKIMFIITHNGHQWTIHFMTHPFGANNPNVTLLHNENNIVLAGAEDFSPPDGTIMSFVRRDNITYEVYRAVAKRKRVQLD